MKAYFFGNRRRLQCVYGAPGAPLVYIPERVFRSSTKFSTPGWRVAPGNAGFPDLFIRHESRGVEVVADTHAGKASLTSGLITATREQESSKTLEIAEGRHRPAVLAEFSLRQSLGSDFLENPNAGIYGATYEPWGEHHQVVSLRSAGGVVCFLEKTAQGYGQRYIRLALRQLEPLAPGPASPGAASHGDSVVSLFTVSEVDGDSESILHSALIPTALVGVGRPAELFPLVSPGGLPFLFQLAAADARVSLVSTEDGEEALYVSVVVPIGPQSIAGWGGNLLDHPYAITRRPLLVHTAVVPYSRPSLDATVFGAIKLPAGLSGQFVQNGVISGLYPSAVVAAYGSTVASGGLRAVEVNHDTLVDVAFMAGATARRDVDNQSVVSTRRDEIEVSELPERLVTGNVRCGADVECAAPEEEGEATQLAPTVEFAAVREPFLAEMYSGSRQVIKAKTLAASAHIVDRSCLAHHSSVVHALPADQSLHLLGKKVSSATVTVAARGKGKITDPFTTVTTRDQYTVTVPENQDISLDQIYELTKGLYSPSSTPIGPQINGQHYAMPIGEFECHPFSIGGAQSAAGLTRASLEQINKQFSYQSPLIPQTNGGAFQRFTGWTMNVTSHAELVAVFGVALQEYGTYRSRDFYLNSALDPGGFDGDGPVSDLEYANAKRPSPASPIGQLVESAVFVPPLSPSPVLCMQLFARTATMIELSDSYDNSLQRPLYGYSSTSQSDEAGSRMIEIGKFMFNKAQTAALMNGDEVTATTWMTARTNLPERNDPGGRVSDQSTDFGESYSLWPQAPEPTEQLNGGFVGPARFWLNFKLRLNIES